MNEQACETKNIKYHFMSRLIIPIEIMIVLISRLWSRRRVFAFWSPFEWQTCLTLRLVLAHNAFLSNLYFFSMKTCSKFYFYRNSIDWADNLIKLNRCLVHADLINRWFFYFYTRFHFQRVCVSHFIHISRKSMEQTRRRRKKNYTFKNRRWYKNA